MRSDTSDQSGSGRSFTEKARRQQILDGAVEVLCGKGFQATSLTAIADHIGVSKGVILYYFDSKSALLHEVGDRLLAAAAAYMRVRVAAAESSHEELRNYVQSNMEFLSDRRTEIRAFIEIVNGFPPGGAEPPPYAAGHARAVAEVTRILRKGQRRKEFGRFAPRTAAIALRAAIDAAEELLREDPDADLKKYGRELLSLFERAVGAAAVSRLP